MNSVSVVVVSHNSEEHLETCLASVDGLGHEIVVVDNASEDGSVDLVRRRFPDVCVIELEHNHGYGGGNNVGIDRTTGGYVLILNPDTRAVEDAVERLVGAAEASPRAAMVGPRLVDESGRHERSVWGFPTVWRLATVYFFLRRLAPWSRAFNAFGGAGVDHEELGEVEWVTGAAMLARRQALAEVGGFDTAFFMYDEEIDLAFRLRKLGWHVLYEPKATVAHVGGGSSGESRLELHREQMRSHVRFLDKHHGRRSAERGRRVLLGAMRFRSVVLWGERRRAASDAANWLAGQDVDMLLGSKTSG